MSPITGLASAITWSSPDSITTGTPNAPASQVFSDGSGTDWPLTRTSRKLVIHVCDRIASSLPAFAWKPTSRTASKSLSKPFIWHQRRRNCPRLSRTPDTRSSGLMLHM